MWASLRRFFTFKRQVVIANCPAAGIDDVEAQASFTIPSPAPRIVVTEPGHKPLIGSQPQAQETAGFGHQQQVSWQDTVSLGTNFNNTNQDVLIHTVAIQNQDVASKIDQQECDGSLRSTPAMVSTVQAGTTTEVDNVPQTDPAATMVQTISRQIPQAPNSGPRSGYGMHPPSQGPMSGSRKHVHQKPKGRSAISTVAPPSSGGGLHPPTPYYMQHQPAHQSILSTVPAAASTARVPNVAPVTTAFSTRSYLPPAPAAMKSAVYAPPLVTAHPSPATTQRPSVNGQQERATTTGKYNIPNIGFKELELIKEIGSGGFGKVYRGRWKGREVAIKVASMKDNSKDRSKAKQEFHREVDIMSNTKTHNNIVKLLAYSDTCPHLALVTEYCPGGSLYSLLHDGHAKPLTYRQLLNMWLGVAQGMAHLHHSCNPPVLHRDLKSANLLVCGSGSSMTLKIADFGLSKASVDKHARTGGLGTSQWMAPEVMSHQIYSTKADVYSFGMCMWESLTREIPYQDVGQGPAMYGVLHCGQRPPIPADTPPELAQLIKKCWAAVADQRPNFEMIIVELRGFLRLWPADVQDASPAAWLVSPPTSRMTTPEPSISFTADHHATVMHTAAAVAGAAATATQQVHGILHGSRAYGVEDKPHMPPPPRPAVPVHNNIQTAVVASPVRQNTLPLPGAHPEVQNTPHGNVRVACESPYRLRTESSDLIEVLSTASVATTASTSTQQSQAGSTTPVRQHAPSPSRSQYPHSPAVQIHMPSIRYSGTSTSFTTASSATRQTLPQLPALPTALQQAGQIAAIPGPLHGASPHAKTGGHVAGFATGLAAASPRITTPRQTIAGGAPPIPHSPHIVLGPGASPQLTLAPPAPPPQVHVVGRAQQAPHTCNIFTLPRHSCSGGKDVHVEHDAGRLSAGGRRTGGVYKPPVGKKPLHDVLPSAANEMLAELPRASRGSSPGFGTGLPDASCVHDQTDTRQGSARLRSPMMHGTWKSPLAASALTSPRTGA